MNLSSLLVAQALLPVCFLRRRLAGGKAFEMVLNLRVPAPHGFRGSGFSPLTRESGEIMRAESVDADRSLHHGTPGYQNTDPSKSKGQAP